MTTGIASGLGATWGLAQESSVGTYTAPTRWLPFISDKVVGNKKVVQSQALNGTLFEMSQRRRITLLEGKGAVELDVTDRQLGLLLKHMIGSTATATQVGSTAAYLQTHIPGDLTGLSLSLQSGRPEISGTIQSFSYTGSKVSEWDISAAVGEIAKLALTFDSWTESISQTYVAPSYVADNVLAFVDGTLLLGGTVSTSAGVTSVSGGAAPVGTVSSVSLKGANGLAVDRQNIGSVTKREQLANAFRKYSGEFEVEFANTTDVYAAYEADSALALQLNFQGVQINSGPTEYAFLNVLCPSVRFNGTPPATDGPEILKFTAPFDILYDGLGDPAIQFQYQSLDTSL